MRKLVLWATGLLLGLVVVATLALVLTVSSLAARYKPAIEARAAAVLGVPVTMGDIRISLFPALRLRMTGVQIGATPGADSGVSADAVAVRVRLWPLLSRELVVDSVRFEAPSATLLKDAAGISLAGLGRAVQQAPPPAASAARQSPPAEPPAAAAEAVGTKVGLTIALQRVDILRGTVIFRDADTNRMVVLNDVDGSASLALRDHSVRISDVHVDGTLGERHPVGVVASNLAYDLGTGSLTFGNATLNLPGGSVTAVGQPTAASGTATVTSPGLRLRELAPFAALALPAAGTLDAAGTVRPELRATWQGTSFDIEGTVVLDSVSGKQGTWKVAGLSGPLAVSVNPKRQVVRTDAVVCSVNGTPAKLGFDLTVESRTARLDRLRVEALSGSMAGDATVSLASGNPFSTRLTGAGLSIADALRFATPERPAVAAGVVTTLALDTRGRAQGHITQTLDGTGRVAMRDVTLKGINLGRAVLDATKGFPFLDGALLGLVPPALRKEFSGNDTHITSMAGDFSIRSGWAETRNLAVVGDHFTATAAGRASTDMELALTSTVALDREVSQAMASSAPELRLFFDRQGRLSIPVKLTGTLPDVAVEPDLVALLKMPGVAGTAQGALDSLLGGKKGSAADLLERLLPR